MPLYRYPSRAVLRTDECGFNLYGSISISKIHGLVCVCEITDLCRRQTFAHSVLPPLSIYSVGAATSMHAGRSRLTTSMPRKAEENQ